MGIKAVSERAVWGFLFVAVAVAGIASMVMIGGGSSDVFSADHLDGPVVGTDGRTDIGDLYVFHPQIGSSDLQDKERTVLAMTVNPAAGVISGTGFDPRAHYEFAIDQNGDAVEDLVYRVRVVGNGNVALTWRIIGGGQPELIAIGRAGSVGFGLGNKTSAVRMFTGLRDDPFFLDLNAFNAGAAFCQGPDGTGSNFFGGLNSSAIVLNLPTDWVGESVGVWARTMVPDSGNKMSQVDRAGRPAISTVFIPPNPFEADEDSLKTSYNTSHPKDDVAKFRAEIVDSLTLLHTLNDATDNTSDDAGKVSGLADILLPDVLTADLSQNTGFLNGRGLADDVIDAELGLITEGAVTTDCVDNDSSFSSVFPYLGKPN